jgi:iron complex transport system ATP-binding protein
VLITHHLEEIPGGFDRALVLGAGRAVASGPIEETLTGPVLGQAFGLPIEVEAQGGRFSAHLGRDDDHGGRAAGGGPSRR